MASGKAITAIIIDDDPFSRDLLKDLIARYVRHVEIKQLCADGEEGLKAINHWQPDIIFLDVEMPVMTGFEMLRKIPQLQSQVIFTSSVRSLCHTGNPFFGFGLFIETG